MATVSFASDVMPILAQFKAQMMWRFDMTNYDQMKANATIIYARIKTKSMPPPPFPPLTDQQIKTFKDWMDGGYQP
jgi:hypothetical protein